MQTNIKANKNLVDKQLYVHILESFIKICHTNNLK